MSAQENQPEIKYEKITIDSHGLETVMARGQEMIQNMATLLLEYMKANEAPNWIKTTLHNEDGEEVIVTIQRGRKDAKETAIDC